MGRIAAVFFNRIQLTVVYNANGNIHVNRLFKVEQTRQNSKTLWWLSAALQGRSVVSVQGFVTPAGETPLERVWLLVSTWPPSLTLMQQGVCDNAGDFLLLTATTILLPIVALLDVY